MSGGRGLKRRSGQRQRSDNTGAAVRQRAAVQNRPHLLRDVGREVADVEVGCEGVAVVKGTARAALAAVAAAASAAAVAGRRRVGRQAALADGALALLARLLLPAGVVLPMVFSRRVQDGGQRGSPRALHPPPVLHFLSTQPTSPKPTS